MTLCRTIRRNFTMRRIPVVAILILVLVCGLSTRPAFAQTATGSIHVNDAAGHPLAIDFTAGAQGASGGQGGLTFSGTVPLPDPDGEQPTELVQATLKVDLDCVVIENNRAAMSGIVRVSSVDAY